MPSGRCVTLPDGVRLTELFGGCRQKQKDRGMKLMELVSADHDRRTKATHPYNYDPFTMWRGPIEPDGCVYTDRIFQWDHKKHDTLCMKHFGDRGQYWYQRDTEKIEAFLRDYLDAPELVLCEVQEHCNQATGYPCWYFAYRKTPNTEAQGRR